LKNRKNIVSLIYWNFSKKGLPKSAILDFAAILEFFKKCSSMEFLLFLNKHVVEEIFEKY
jgi:hypothetical protein